MVLTIHAALMPFPYHENSSLMTWMRLSWAEGPGKQNLAGGTDNHIALGMLSATAKDSSPNHLNKQGLLVAPFPLRTMVSIRDACTQ